MTRKPNRRSAIILSFSRVEKDPRVLRQIEALKTEFELTIAGLGPFTSTTKNFIHLKNPKRNFLRKVLNGISLVLGFCEFSYWSQPRVKVAEKQLAKLGPFDLLVANEIGALPLALRLAKMWGAKVIFDAHEYYPAHMPQRLYFRFVGSRLWRVLCRRYIPKADLCMTVSQGIADEYRNFCGKEFFLFLNTPSYQALKPRPVGARRVNLVHHGIFSPVREPEAMVELLKRLDERFHLNLMFVAEGASKPLYENFKKAHQSNSRIHFLDPVDVEGISKRINEFDIGIFLLRIRSINNRFALPNKLFEFIQGRLAVALWPSPEMEKVVKKFNAGWVSADATVTSIAGILNKLSHTDIYQAKLNSEIASREFASENSAAILREKVQTLFTSEQKLPENRPSTSSRT
jgi:glycosyltransferase involved in cell wall biosynthesis